MLDLLLNKISFDDVDIFIASSPNLFLFQQDLWNFKNNRLSLYLNNPEYNSLIDHNAKKRKSEKIGVLYAHGAYAKAGINLRKWLFDDSNSLHKVQDWVDKHDGEYNLLMLCCYTPEAIKKHSIIHSKKSVLMIPDDGYLKKNVPEEVHSRLYVPKIGLIDATNVDKYLEKIRKIA